MAETENPYAAPHSQLFDTLALPYFAVSQTKFAVLSIATLGWYPFWWTYKNWQALLRRSGENLSPVLRGFTAPLSCIWLFPRLYSEAKTHGVPASGDPQLLAMAVFCAGVSWPLPGWFSILWSFGFLAFMPVNAVASRLNRSLAPTAPPEVAWSTVNTLGVAAIAIGIALLVLA